MDGAADNGTPRRAAPASKRPFLTWLLIDRRALADLESLLASPEGRHRAVVDQIALALEEKVPARTKPAASKVPTGLTRRELEIAELVAQGMS